MNEDAVTRSHFDERMDELEEHIDKLPIRTTTRNNRRGEKNTRFMQIQRRAVGIYINVELHKALEDVSLDDCRRVWNNPDNKHEWDRRANLTNSRRGYQDPQSLFAACKYWFSKEDERRKILFD